MRCAFLFILVLGCGRGDVASPPAAPSPEPRPPAPARQSNVPKAERRSAEIEARAMEAAEPEEPNDGLTFDVSVDGDTPVPAAILKSVRRSVLDARAGIRHCFDDKLAAEPGFVGRIVATWSIAPDGRVPSSSIAETTVQNDRIEECLLSRIGQITFHDVGAGPLLTRARIELGATRR